MAGHGPPPKKDRATRHAPQRGDWVTLPVDSLGTLPELPAGPRGGWSDAAVREWTRWWDSPMAHMWDDSDAGLVEMLLYMTEEFWQKPTGSMANQIRQIKDSLGLTPKGRQDRRWELPQEAEEPEKPKARARSGSDPRK